MLTTTKFFILVKNPGYPREFTSRSTVYVTEKEAVEKAKSLIEDGKGEVYYVMETTRVVRLSRPPIVVEKVK